MNSNMDSDKAKLFVGGISRETTNDILRNHFSKYGVVLDSAISVDRITQCPRGFGFVTFSDLSEAEKALQDCHVILGRTVEVKKAIPRSEQQHQIQVQNKGVSDYRSSNDYRCDQFRTKKIFVGGLSASISKEEFKSYFERFGRITDVVVMQDSLTHRPRGFGFITFESEESVENVVVQSFYDLNGRQVEVKRAVPKEGNYGSDGFSKSRYTKNERGAYQSYPPFSPRYMSPCFSPLPYYTSGGVYAYGSNPYDYCYTMGGYGGNGFTVASDASRNFWYGPMVANPQAYQLPYTNAPPSVAYTGGSVGIVGGPGTRGYNGFVPYYVMPPQSYKLNSDSTRFRGSNGEISS